MRTQTVTGRSRAKQCFACRVSMFLWVFGVGLVFPSLLAASDSVPDDSQTPCGMSAMLPDTVNLRVESRDYVNVVRFSSNGQWVAAATNTTIVVLNGCTHQQLWHVPIDSPDSVSMLTFSWDGGVLAALHHNGNVVLYDVANGQIITILTGGTEFATLYGRDPIVFSADGALIVGGSAGGARVWRVADGRLLAVLYTRPAPLYGIAFSSDGMTLTTIEGNAVGVSNTSTPARARFWSTTDWSLRDTYEFDTYTSVGDFTADAKHLMIVTFKGGVVRVQYWDASDHEFVLNREIAAGNENYTAGAFSPSGDLFALGVAKVGTIRIWNIAPSGGEMVLTGHTDPITSVSFSPDGRVLVSASFDGTIRFWPVTLGG